MGVGSAVFKRMTRANERGVTVVFKKAERLFVKLQRVVIAPFSDWVALGTVELEPFLQKHLKTVSVTSTAPEWRTQH